jgi:hypothetical protein
VRNISNSALPGAVIYASPCRARAPRRRPSHEGERELGNGAPNAAETGVVSRDGNLFREVNFLDRVQQPNAVRHWTLKSLSARD